MIASRGPNIFELDRLASEANSPYLIYTADDHPHEIDDGIAVEPLPCSQETYRVRVCVADTSKAYLNDDLLHRAQNKVEARYLHPDGSDEYVPMLPLHLINSLQFKADNRERSALVISYVVGVNEAPSNVEFQFGMVKAIRNYSYRTFGTKGHYSPDKQPISRAALLTRRHLGLHNGWLKNALIEEAGFVPSRQMAKKGMEMVTTFMVAANHLVGLAMRDAPLAIFRVHDPEDNGNEEFLANDSAFFSRTPGPHIGLGVDPYTRVTSPLRRVEDFTMSGLLKVYATGRTPGARDHRETLETIRALNQKIADNQRRARRARVASQFAARQKMQPVGDNAKELAS